MSELRRADKMGKDAIKHFESTRHLLLYYEDLVSNHTVSPLVKNNSVCAFARQDVSYTFIKHGNRYVPSRFQFVEAGDIVQKHCSLCHLCTQKLIKKKLL
jgi:uncharacterized membrane protein